MRKPRLESVLKSINRARRAMGMPALTAMPKPSQGWRMNAAGSSLAKALGADMVAEWKKPCWNCGKALVNVFCNERQARALKRVWPKSFARGANDSWTVTLPQNLARYYFEVDAPAFADPETRKAA